MKKIRINRKKWARASFEGYEGRLWNAGEGKGCCLGHLIHQVSKCSWDKLDGLITPDDFYTKVGILTSVLTKRGEQYNYTKKDLELLHQDLEKLENDKSR